MMNRRLELAIQSEKPSYESLKSIYHKRIAKASSTFVKTTVEANELPKLITTTRRSGRDHHWSFSDAISNRFNGVYWHWRWNRSERARKEKNDWRRAETKGKKYLLSEILGTNEPHYFPCDDFPNSSGTSESRRKIDVAKGRFRKST